MASDTLTVCWPAGLHPQAGLPLAPGVGGLLASLLLSVLDLEDGGVVVQNGQDNLVHVLSQPEVDLLLLF